MVIRVKVLRTKRYWTVTGSLGIMGTIERQQRNGRNEMAYHNFTVIVRFEGEVENMVFSDIVAVDQNAAHADLVAAYGECELVGFKQA